ncbi:MAG: beta-eliminating lyase-related protein [Alkalispirochaeta sp.]
MRQLFASDNASPVHPAILSALTELNRDHEISYGDDAATGEARRRLQELFGVDCGVYFVYNGTGANVGALRTMARSFEAVICTEMAHINEDEGGAPEAIGGFKLLGVHREDGRLRPEDITPFLARRGFEHTNQPTAVSLTQATEVGTVYWPEELHTLVQGAHDAGLAVHMDGARISNAAAAVWERAHSAGDGSRLSPRDALRAVTVDSGVDVLSFGATKNGLLFGEAVIFFNRDLEEPFRFFRKQTTQLHSKMRYISAQFSRYVHDDLWMENALRANRLARELGGGLAEISGFEVALPTEANGVFVTIPQPAIAALQEEFGFYLWNADANLARLMVSWDTTEATIAAFIERARACAL